MKVSAIRRKSGPLLGCCCFRGDGKPEEDALLPCKTTLGHQGKQKIADFRNRVRPKGLTYALADIGSPCRR
jgi:hypothetical protein